MASAAIWPWYAREFTNNLGSCDQRVLFCLASEHKGGGYDRRRNERHVMGTVTLRRASLGCSMSGRVYVTVE